MATSRTLPPRRVWQIAVALVVVAASCGLAWGGPVASFDDIQYWVGSGANRAAIVIDWDSASTTIESLVWGFRWDGEARGEDLLLAVVNDDPRLYLKRSSGGALGFSAYGIGYDANNDGQFALSDDTPFDEQGVAVTGLPDEDAQPIDPADMYREGRLTGVWSYGLAQGASWDSLTWSQAFTGPRGRTLQNDSWDSWAFAAPIVLGAYAKNPWSAERPPFSTSADFDADGDVDGADFLTWQRGFGAAGAAPSQGDANGDSAVDGEDLTVWRNSWDGSPPAAGAPLAVPEPAGLAISVYVTFVSLMYRNLKERSS
jgi:hypothetical protein